MSYYINCIKTNSEVTRDIKELIPCMNTRRRMSAILKMGVTTAMEVIADFDGGNLPQIDAIITASRLGCIADSEKFLANIIDNNEQMLNPTPFIQSTFNTVGGQIALLKKLHCYNSTYSHREICLESALIDAMIRLDRGVSKAALVGVFDEITPTVERVLQRLKVKGHKSGALFFVLTKERFASSCAEIISLSFGEDSNKITQPSPIDKHVINTLDTAFAIKEVIENKLNEVIIKNLSGNKINSVIELRCL